MSPDRSDRGPLDAAAPAGSTPSSALSDLTASASLTPLAWQDLPGWASDDHVAALHAFARSCHLLDGVGGGHWQGFIAAVRSCLADGEPSPEAAKGVFEAGLRPWRVAEAEETLLTGYFEPVVRAAHVRNDAYTAPLYRRPDDLVSIGDDARRASPPGGLSYARQTTSGALEAYPTRADIEAGALAGRGLELAFVSDRVDAFILQVQGSGVLAFDDGTRLRIGYDGKNGHPYVSIGQHLIAQGRMSANAMSLDRLIDYLRNEVDDLVELLNANPSFVFFQALSAEEPGPIGAREVALVAGRSLAVDPRYHDLGTPIFVATEDAVAPGGPPLTQTFVAHDVGSAIQGPARGDVFFGTGPEAGRAAGALKSGGQFIVLLPRNLSFPDAGGPQP